MNASEKLSQLLETARKASEGEWAMTSSKDIEAVVQACMLMMEALGVIGRSWARDHECAAQQHAVNALAQAEKLLGGGAE